MIITITTDWVKISSAVIASIKRKQEMITITKLRRAITKSILKIKMRKALLIIINMTRHIEERGLLDK
jgi:hypothetical protein